MGRGPPRESGGSGRENAAGGRRLGGNHVEKVEGGCAGRSGGGSGIGNAAGIELSTPSDSFGTMLLMHICIMVPGVSLIVIHRRRHIGSNPL